MPAGSLSRRLVQAIAPRLGLVVNVAPPGTPLQIRTRDGRRFYSLGSRFDLNPVRATQITRNKALCAFHLARMGYPVPDGRTLIRQEMAAGYRYGRDTLGFPFVVKPNVGSLGQGVAVVRSRREYYEATRLIFDRSRHENVLAQRRIEGDDFRIVVLDHDVVAAYRRRPFAVVGDGTHTLLELADRRLTALVEQGLPVTIRPDDPRITRWLAHCGLSESHVPLANTRVSLLETANLSTGGDGEDLSEQISPDLRRVAVMIARELGLRLCGIDLMGPASLDASPERYTVLEVNGAPRFDHFFSLGEAQRRRVEMIHDRILRALVEQ